jgi:hypothetical protein
MKKIITLFTVLVVGVLAMACGDAGSNNATSSNSKTPANQANTSTMSNIAQSASNTLSSVANTVSNAASSAVNSVKGPPSNAPANAAKANSANATKK